MLTHPVELNAIYEIYYRYHPADFCEERHQTHPKRGDATTRFPSLKLLFFSSRFWEDRGQDATAVPPFATWPQNVQNLHVTTPDHGQSLPAGNEPLPFGGFQPRSRASGALLLLSTGSCPQQNLVSQGVAQAGGHSRNNISLRAEERNTDSLPENEVFFSPQISPSPPIAPNPQNSLLQDTGWHCLLALAPILLEASPARGRPWVSARLGSASRGRGLKGGSGGMEEEEHPSFQEKLLQDGGSLSDSPCSQRAGLSVHPSVSPSSCLSACSTAPLDIHPPNSPFSYLSTQPPIHPLSALSLTHLPPHPSIHPSNNPSPSAHPSSLTSIHRPSIHPPSGPQPCRAHHTSRAPWPSH